MYKLTAVALLWVLYAVSRSVVADSSPVTAAAERSVDMQGAVAAQSLQQGLDFLDQGRASTALEPLQRALDLYRFAGDRPGEGRALKALGNVYHALSDYSRAEDFQRQALELARTLDDQDLQCRALINLASLSRDQDRLDEASSRYRQALAIAGRLPNTALDAVGYSGLGVVLYKRGDYGGAAEILERALGLAQQTGQRGVEAASAVYLGRTYEAQQRLPEAIAAYQDALTLARDLGNRGGELSVLSALASAHYQQKDYAEAIAYAGANLAGAEVLGLPDQAAASLGLLTTAHIALGDNATALTFAVRQLDQARQLGDQSLQGVALEQVGVNHLALADYLKAIDAFSEMLQIGRQLADFSLESKALRNLGQVYLTLGEPDMASEHFQEQLTRADAAGDRQQIYDAAQNLGDLGIQRGDIAGALEYYQRSLAAAEGLPDQRWRVRSLIRLGNGYHYLGDQRAAISYAERALALAASFDAVWERGRALQILGRAYLGLGDRKALDYFEGYAALTKQLNVRAEHLALNELGSAYLVLDDHDKAIAILRQSLERARHSGDLEGQGAAHERLAAAFIETGDPPAAEGALRDAVTVWESVRAGLGTHDAFKVSVFERQTDAYQQLQRVLMARGKTEAALEVAERGRARAFVELLARRLSPNPTEISPPPDIAQIRRVAAERNATLVEYSILGKDGPLLVWVVRPNGDIVTREVAFDQARLDPMRSLETLVRDGRARLGVRGIGHPPDPQSSAMEKTSDATAGDALRGSRRRLVPRPNDAGYEGLIQLHRLLIEPIADLLPSDPKDLVVFIPQGPLFLVPFPALQGSDGRYLVERHTMSTAPSIQVLMLTRDERDRLWSADQEERLSGVLDRGLVVGNPTMPRLPGWSEPLPALPGAEAEAGLVAGLLETSPVLGDRATKSLVLSRLGDARLVHLATHGILDDDRGLGSAVALAPTATDDGLLTAEEILGLDLQADLVVLSACNTGRGRITGDGVIGLSRSFLSAGAPSVIVSLWAVPDAPTASLMGELYKNLKKQQDKARALRHAMLTTMQQHPNPLRWAGFTLIGESRSLEN